MSFGWGQVNCGDVNNDGDANVQDVVIIVDCSLEPACYIENADLIEDGLVNVLDIVNLIDRILNPTNYLIGTYNVDVNFGMTENGECIIDSSMNPFTPGATITEQITLDSNSQFQDFAIQTTEFSTIPVMEYQVDSINTASACYEFAESTGSAYGCGSDWEEGEEWEDECLFYTEVECLINENCSWQIDEFNPEFGFCILGSYSDCWGSASETECISNENCYWIIDMHNPEFGYCNLDYSCECFVQYTEESCDLNGGEWELPPWIEEEDEWTVYFCMMPMTEDDCFQMGDFEDICGGFDGNLEISWDEASNTCTHSSSFYQEGTWYVDGECLVIETELPECSNQQTQDTCYCLPNCQWDIESDDCTDLDDNGRNNSQSKMKQYLDGMYKFNSNYKLLSGDRECMDFTQDCEGNIFIYNEFGDGMGMGFNCIEVILTLMND
jgi:hypothetical protein